MDAATAQERALAQQQAQTLATQMVARGASERLRIVVMGVGSYGDILQTTPLLRQLRTRFATAHIALVHTHGAVTSLLDGLDVVDDTHVLNALAHDELPNAFTADLWVRCRYVIEYQLPEASRLCDDDRAFVRAAQDRQASWLPYTVNFPFDNDQLWRAANAQGMNLYRLMAHTSGFDAGDFERFELALQTEASELRRELPERYVVLCNSAEALTVTRNTWTKTLSADKMSRIARKLRRANITTVLLGGSRDETLVDGVDYDWRGRTSLHQAAAILRDATTFIAPEGGIANLANAVGRNGVVFFGSTPSPFFALRANHNVLPPVCGGCWFTTPSYLYHCPRLIHTPICVQSLSEDDIVHAARQRFA